MVEGVKEKIWVVGLLFLWFPSIGLCPAWGIIMLETVYIMYLSVKDF
jgi:hypothetical protein